MSPKKFAPDRFSRFDVYWIQTDRQTNGQTDKPNLYIDIYISAYISVYIYLIQQILNQMDKYKDMENMKEGKCSGSLINSIRFFLTGDHFLLYPNICFLKTLIYL